MNLGVSQFLSSQRGDWLKRQLKDVTRTSSAASSSTVSVLVPFDATNINWRRDAAKTRRRGRLRYAQRTFSVPLIRTRVVRRLVEDSPKQPQLFDRLHELFEIDGLHDISVH